MNLLEKANEFENRKFSFKTTSDRILASREVKDELFGNVLKGMDAVKLTKRDLKQE